MRTCASTSTSSRRVRPRSSARRADDAEDPDDLLRGVAEGGRDHRRAREREELVLGADEDAHALAALGAGEELDHVGLRLEIGEEQADALEILRGVEVLQEIG